MKNLLLTLAILAISPSVLANQESSEKSIEEIKALGKQMTKEGLSSIESGLLSLKNDTAGATCQHFGVSEFQNFYSKNKHLVENVVIKDDIFKAQFNEIYTKFSIDPEYKYSFLHYSGAVLDFFEDPSTVTSFCYDKEFRVLFSNLSDRMQYLSDFQ